MPKARISLTTFVDFVMASGTPKLTIVKNAIALYSEEYTPAIDFWGHLRYGIIEMHKENQSKEMLDDILMNLKDQRKRLLYENNVRSYKRWMGRKQFEWSGRELVPWQYVDLQVNVNPELGLIVDGQEQLIKLYFKAEPLSKRRIETILYLIGKTLPQRNEGALPAILDVPRSRLLKPTISIDDMESLLIGEAVAFMTMWNSLSVRN